MVNNFPKLISLTITNKCNLRCKMCGQWSKTGYMHSKKSDSTEALSIEYWKKIVDEIAQNNVKTIIIRGGEPFLFQGIMELITYIDSKNISISIDTNGTVLKKYVDDLIKIKNLHLTFSIDGPEKIHDAVRGISGAFQQTAEGIKSLQDAEKNGKFKISKSICFTISKYSYPGLGTMPDVARSLSIDTLVIVPYFYVPCSVGKKYEEELKRHFDCQVFSWHGFHHENSGIDIDKFNSELRKYKESLNEITNYPYLDLTEEEYYQWFQSTGTVIKNPECFNIERLADIQPNGDVNFCVDFPDYSIGNIKNSSIAELWNSERADNFRQYRRMKQFAICNRCGSRYMSQFES